MGKNTYGAPPMADRYPRVSRQGTVDVQGGLSTPAAHRMDRGLHNTLRNASNAGMKLTGHTSGPTVPMMDSSVSEESLRAVDNARWLFRQTLAHWASDLLVLRQVGLTRPPWTKASLPTWTEAA